MQNEKSKPCILVFPKDGIRIGGKTLGWTDELRSELVWAVPAQGAAYLGFMLQFPVKPVQNVLSARYGTENQQEVPAPKVRAKFFPGAFEAPKSWRITSAEDPLFQFLPPTDRDAAQGWLAVRIKGTPRPDGWPLPFTGDEPYTGWFNRDEPIKGYIRLSRLLCRENEFTFIVKGTTWSGPLGKVSKIIQENRFTYGLPSRYVGLLLPELSKLPLFR